jgi:hypothetical protein
MTHSPILKPQPRSRFTTGAARSDGVPMPLTGEHVRIVIRGGLALITREQSFRNPEAQSIEATLTFPMPVHASLCSLSAELGRRRLLAKAFPREAARDRYEKAIDAGKTAVLHEGMARGIHMLSIAHLPPGADVKVTHAWMSALSPREAGRAHLRVPVTVGHVYGVSPFTDADDLAISADVVREASVEIDAGGRKASVAGAALVDGKVKLRLDAPIDIEIEGEIDIPVRGVSADGRSVRVSVTPDLGGDRDIEAAILVDRSGSMNDIASASGVGIERRSKHAAVVAGLADAARAARPRDRFELWQFDNACERVSDAAIPLVEAVKGLAGPRGGTEIGGALHTVLTASTVADILLITDGLSHALEVQSLANSGRRFTVVLIGEDSLEANVGHLAALTGGQILLATGAADAASSVVRAMASLRRPKAPRGAASWPLERASLHAGGALVEARWETSRAEPDQPEFARAVGAFTAAIALPLLREEQAAKVAAEHGLVCHLTSLMLVDEEGTVQEGLPAQRKLPLMAPRGRALAHVASAAPAAAPAAPLVPTAARMAAPRLDDGVFFSLRRDPAPASTSPPPRPSLAETAKEIDWGADPEALRRGDLSALKPKLADAVTRASELKEVRAVAGQDGNAVALVLGLLAKSLGASHRAAARLARSLLKGLSQKVIAKLIAALGL